MFSLRIRAKSLVIVCRSLATMIDAGIPIGKAFELASKKSGDLRSKHVMTEIAADLRRGLDVTESMRARGQAFPETMIELVGVAEQTGTLPEVLKSLAGHYENTIRLRREFFSKISLPAFQLVAAILVIALMLYILGMIAESHPGTKAVDILGLGLYGARGAMIWLGATFGGLFGAIVLALIIRRSLLGQRIFDSFLLQIPVLGGCLRSLAIARFSWSFALTQQAGMSIEPSLAASFKATSNGAFLKASPHVWAAVREGETLHTALSETRLFPIDYLHIIDVAETTGTVPETLERISPELEGQARRAMDMLASAAAWSIWCLVAAFIVFLIFRVAMFYIGQLNDAVNMAK